ncbi:MAG: hypothetical protein GC184_01270 [Rhizobiales bacterium]|nr:hypothetical protein [Hyphomicrobiales bacterium]
MRNHLLARVFGLSIRWQIALAITLSLIAVQAQAVTQMWLYGSPEIYFYGTNWLANNVSEVAEDIFSKEDSLRNDFLSTVMREDPVTFLWSPQRPWNGPVEHLNPAAQKLETTLKGKLRGKIQAIEIRETSVKYPFPNHAFKIRLLPTSITKDIDQSSLAANQPEVLLPSNLAIAIQGLDGTWLYVRPNPFDKRNAPSGFPFGPLIMGGLIIAIFSTLTAWRILSPLDRFLVAANKIGTTRDFVPISTSGLGEFVPVAVAFEEVQKRLFHFINDRTRMLAAISHDLRSSLTRVRIAAENAEQIEDRLSLLNEIDDMQAMVESTLAFASGDAEAMSSQTLDIAALLISLVDQANDLGKDCAYNGPDHIEIHGHPLSLKRALWNLIDNAIKYGKVAFVQLDIEKDAVRIEIDDRGPGIRTDLIEEAFAPFRRLDPSRGSGASGVGLGLTIARDVIKNHGGSIRLQNREMGGLGVILILPRDLSLPEQSGA